LLAELVLAEDKDARKLMFEYSRRLRKLLREDFFEIVGPNRLSDTQWLSRFHGKMPRIGNLMGDNETEK